MTVTVDGATFQVPFTLGSAGTAVAYTPTTAAPKTTTTTAPKAATTTSTAPKAAAPTTTAPTTAGTVSGVAVAPGQSIQAAVDKNPAGTTFVIKAGVHKRQSVIPKTGDTFVGESGAVLTGEGVTEFAFAGKNSDKVTIRGLVIEKYATPLQEGVVRGGSGSDGWLVENNEIRYNQGIGLKSSTGWRVVGNYIHHNQQMGLGGTGSNMVIDGNEIAFNNYQKEVNPSWGGGGSKWVHSTDLVVRNNYSHDNYGPGLWTDGNNLNVVYEGNRVENNYHAGIKHEVSCDAVIRNNTVIGNGFGNDGWIAGAGILVANSPNVEVYGNVVRNNNDGIGGVNATRSHSTDQRCKIELRNFWVHDNTIEMKVGHTGIVTNIDSSVVTSMNNRFDRNTYILPNDGPFYRWGSTGITAAQWKAAGQDTNGTWK
jgi:parallel beta-helix repeat protein